MMYTKDQALRIRAMELAIGHHPSTTNKSTLELAEDIFGYIKSGPARPKSGPKLPTKLKPPASSVRRGRSS